MVGNYWKDLHFHFGDCPLSFVGIHSCEFGVEASLLKSEPCVLIEPSVLCLVFTNDSQDGQHLLKEMKNGLRIDLKGCSAPADD